MILFWAEVEEEEDDDENSVFPALMKMEDVDEIWSVVYLGVCPR